MRRQRRFYTEFVSEPEDFVRVFKEAFKSAVEVGLEKRLRQVFGVDPRELVKVGEARIEVKGACGSLHILLTDSVAVDRLDMCIEGISSIAAGRQPAVHNLTAAVTFLAKKIADEYGILGAAGSAVFLPGSRICNPDNAYSRLVDEYSRSRKLTEGVNLLLKDMGVELDVTQRELVVKT